MSVLAFQFDRTKRESPRSLTLLLVDWDIAQSCAHGCITMITASGFGCKGKDICTWSVSFIFDLLFIALQYFQIKYWRKLILKNIFKSNSPYAQYAYHTAINQLCIKFINVFRFWVLFSRFHGSNNFVFDDIVEFFSPTSLKLLTLLLT